MRAWNLVIESNKVKFVPLPGILSMPQARPGFLAMVDPTPPNFGIEYFVGGEGVTQSKSTFLFRRAYGVPIY